MDKDLSVSAVLLEFAPADKDNLLGNSQEWGKIDTGLLVKIKGLTKGSRNVRGMNKNSNSGKDNQMIP